MKTLKVLVLSALFLGSFAASADCSKAYSANIRTGVINSVGGMLILPLGIHQSYQTHQMRKMDQLIKEAKQSRIGKRTKGLMKSLNGFKTAKEIHKIVRANNKLGGFCVNVRGADLRDNKTAVALYRDFKNSLRLEIDKELVAKGKSPIWTDYEDL